eukprot:2996624-Lingulodinium_polyedra.AAC.1
MPLGPLPGQTETRPPVSVVGTRPVFPTQTVPEAMEHASGGSVDLREWFQRLERLMERRARGFLTDA